jgi:uncharacterized protein YndB with AHSA1/START domain
MSEIFHRVGIEANPDLVFQALTTQSGLSGWWTEETKAKAEEGALLTFQFGKYGSVKMEVVALVPGRKV